MSTSESIACRDEIYAQKATGVRHGWSTDELSPARKTRFLQVVGMDEGERPKPRPIGKDVVVALPLCIAPDLIRWRSTFLLPAQNLIRSPVFGVDPPTIRSPAGYRVPATLLERPVRIV